MENEISKTKQKLKKWKLPNEVTAERQLQMSLQSNSKKT